MSLQVLNPTSEEVIEERSLAKRLSTLEGATVGFISNGKEGTDRFFSSLTGVLYEQFSVAEVVLTTKSNYSAPADQTLIDEARDWHAVVTGVGD
jgi:hypothetical protein